MLEKIPIVPARLVGYLTPQRPLRYRRVLSLVLILAFLLTLLPGGAMAAPAESPHYNGAYHWVRPGDTLSEIAVWYGTTVHALMYANGLKNPNHIYVGQKLYIPDGYGHPGHPGHPGKPPQGGPKCAFYHTVQYGQSLAAIANYYGVNLWTLAQINAIYDTNHIFAGQILCIPGGYAPPRRHHTSPRQAHHRDRRRDNAPISCALAIRWRRLPIGTGRPLRSWSISTTSGMSTSFMWGKF